MLKKIMMIGLFSAICIGNVNSEIVMEIFEANEVITLSSKHSAISAWEDAIAFMNTIPRENIIACIPTNTAKTNFLDFIMVIYDNDFSK